MEQIYFGEKTSPGLAVFSGNEGNFREMYHFDRYEILVLLIEICIYESYYVSHTFALMVRRKII